MKRRPLLSFTVCWITGSSLACLFSGHRLLILSAVSLLLLGVSAMCGRLGWKYTVVLGMSLAAGALYWEWSEARNVSSLPEMLNMPAAELNESQVEAKGIIVSPVERDGDRVDFTLKLSGIRKKDTGAAQQLLASDSDAKHIEDSAVNVKEPDSAALPKDKIRSELIAVQIKLQAEAEIVVAAEWRRGDTVELNVGF